jgi:hypothetical protein
MEIDKKEVIIIGIIVVAAFVAAYPFIPYFHQNNTVTTSSSGSGGSTAGASAQPYVDYITSSGEVIREYLNTGQIYIVEPDGQLEPYSNSLTFVAPSTTTAVTDVQYGFTLTLTGQYLEGTSSAQNITVTVTADLEGNGTGQSYTIFNAANYPYSISGSPTSKVTGTETITSSAYNMTTLAQDIWGTGFSTASTATYWPQYYVSITAKATNVFGQQLQSTASTTYPYTTIGAWQWAAPQLSVSLGSASTTYSIIPGVSNTNLAIGIVIIAAIVLAMYMFVRRER